MASHVEAARELLDRASDTAGADVRENVLHVDQGLQEVVGGDLTEDASPKPDRLDELAEKLAGLERRTDGETREQLRAARTHVEALREEA